MEEEFFDKLKKSSGEEAVRDTISGYQTEDDVKDIIGKIMGDI